MPSEDVEQIKKKKKDKSETVTKMMGIYEKLRRYLSVFSIDCHIT